MKKIFAFIITLAIFSFMGVRGFQEVSHGTHMMDGKIMSGHEMAEADSSGTSSDECAKSCFVNTKREVFRAVFFAPSTIQKSVILLVFAALMLLAFSVFRSLRTFRLQYVPIKNFSGPANTVLRE